MGNESDKALSIEAIRNQVQAHWKQKVKMIGSLGKLETITIQLAQIQQTHEISVHPKRILIFAGSHGICHEGVSAYPSEITGQMVLTYLSGGAPINVLCRQHSIDLKIIDVGVDTHWPDGLIPNPHLIWEPISRGTRNLLKEPAMLPSECERALQIGRDQVLQAVRDGIKILGLGELGIGNTSSASALCCALLHLNPVSVVGRGTGLSDDALQRKIHVVTRAIALHQSNVKSPLDWLQVVGGFEIAALTGAILEAKHHHIPIILDNFVATSAAVVAFAHDPECRDHCIFSHCSHERGHQLILEMLGVEALLDLKLSLGEGTSAALAIPIIESAARLYREVATFESVKVSRKKD